MLENESQMQYKNNYQLLRQTDNEVNLNKSNVLSNINKSRVIGKIYFKIKKNKRC